MIVPDNEFTIQLPLDAVCQSSGFSLDVGGSVAKAAYRAKEEYMLGKPRDETQYQTGVGQLHLALFARERISDVLSYLKQKCDVLKTPEFDSLFCCGLGGNEFASLIEKEFGLKVINTWEGDDIATVIPYLLNHYPDTCYERSEEGLTEAQPLIKQYLSRYEKEDGEKHQYFEGDGKFSLDEKQGGNVQYPFILTMMGSALAYFKVLNSEGHHTHIDSNMSGGRFYMGVASQITRITDYNDMQKQIDESSASSAVLHKGIHLPGDVQHDIYDGSNTGRSEKADAARGLQEAMCEIIAHGMYYAARVAKVKTIYCIGNFANPPDVKKWITKYVTLKNAIMPRDEAVRVEFIRHGGFMGALGTYLHPYLQAQHTADTI